MNHIEQSLKILFENHFNYQEKDFKDLTPDDKNLKNNSDFLERNKDSNISIITGSNGIGKTYFLENLEKEFQENGCQSQFIPLKKINSLDKLIEQIKSTSEYLILDGLDELSSNIFEEVKNYLFSINTQKLIISSRKDFLQKSNMFNAHYDIYELMPFADYTVQDILSQNSIDKKTVNDIYSLIKIPRFMNYVLEIKNEIKNLQLINKYDLLDIIVNKHLDILNNRSSIIIEKHIHKKILQTMALIMMMLGKMSLTLEEFTVLLSNIDSLDIKTYILNKDIFETFTANQILLNDGFSISFDCKELMEFLAAKEIVENNFSNEDLYSLVIDSKNDNIDPLWFNTLSYISTTSPIYRKLILDYILVNIEKKDSLLDLLFNLNLSHQDLDFILHIINPIIKQYTKLYQYIDIHDTSQSIFNILSVDYTSILNILISIIEALPIANNNDSFNNIYINNLLTCIENIVRCANKKRISLITLKKFLNKNLDLFFYNNNFNVRFLIIYLQVSTVHQIDNFIKTHKISTRQLSLILHYCKSCDNLTEIDSVINNYIFNSKNSFRLNEFIISDFTLKDFIQKNYDLARINNLLSSIDNDTKISGLIHFLNTINSPEFFLKFDNKSSADILYRNVILPFVTPGADISQLKEEIFWERHHDYFVFRNFLEICIKHDIIDINTITPNNENYISQIIFDLILKIYLNNDTNFDELYSNIENKHDLFKVWSLDLTQEMQKYYKNDIQKYFPNELSEYLIKKEKYSNYDYINLEKHLEEIEFNSNIYFIIDNLHSLLSEEKYLSIINSNTILTNRIRKIITSIIMYIDKVDVFNLTLIYSSEKTYTLSYDYIYYPKAIFILYKMNYDINKYNFKNIIMHATYMNELPIKYSFKDYKYFTDYLETAASKEYIKRFLDSIIRVLGNHNPKKLLKLLLEWITTINFDEYETNQILEFIYEHRKHLSATILKKIKRFNNSKICQDLFISLDIESFIAERITYIKNTFALEGDIIENKTNVTSEFYSESYTKDLFNINIKYQKYIVDILEFAFQKYNTGDYYYFLKYILNLAYNYIKNNIQYSEIDNLIDRITELEKNAKNRYFYSTCLSIKNLKTIKKTNIYTVISTFNHLINKYYNKIYTYNELYDTIKEILETTIFDDIQRMKFFEIFKTRKKDYLPLKEETYQFLLGYELERILAQKGFNTKIIFEAAAFDKKRCDILIICNGFIQNIVIETKLTTNNDLSRKKSSNLY